MRDLKITALAGCFALASLAMAAPASAATNLLTNGGFEDTGGALPQAWAPMGNGWTFGSAPGHPDDTPVGGSNVGLPGWVVASGDVDITDHYSGWSPPKEGNNSLDIDGWVEGDIYQDITTLVGKVYALSYFYSRNAASAPNPVDADISIGTSVDHIVAYNLPAVFGSVNGMLWKGGYLTFTATSTSTRVELKGLNGGNGGVYFDALSAVAVPEPATWALMIGGFGMAGAMLRRRRLSVAA